VLIEAVDSVYVWFHLWMRQNWFWHVWFL